MKDRQELSSEIKEFIFVRGDGFYPIELPEGTVVDNAKCNPGTIRVLDAITGVTVWEEEP